MSPLRRLTLEDAAARLRGGGIVAYPTETFYGLGALATNEDALRRLAAAKLRPEGKPLPLVAADRAQVEEVASLPEGPLRRLADAFWPGPLTLVLPARPGLLAALTAGTGTVGVRIPGSALARELARLAGGALVSTSANLSGEAPPASPAELSPALAGRIEGVLDGGRTPGGLPSTLVSVDPVTGELRLLRAGPISFQAALASAARPG